MGSEVDTKIWVNYPVKPVTLKVHVTSLGLTLLFVPEQHSLICSGFNILGSGSSRRRGVILSLRYDYQSDLVHSDITLRLTLFTRFSPIEINIYFFDSEVL